MKEFSERIQDILNMNEVLDYDCISIYDVTNLIKSKIELLEKIKEEYEEKLNKIIKSEIGDSSSIKICSFDYEKQEIKILFSIDPFFDSIFVYFSKQGDDLKITGAERDTYNGKLLLVIGDVIEEVCEKYIEFSDLSMQESHDIKSLGSNFLVDITNDYTGISDQSNSQNEDDKLLLSWSNIVKNYKSNYNSLNIIKSIKGKEEEIFKKIFVKIEDCPKWMQKKLYEIRKKQLIEKSKNHDKLEKKDNYEILLDKIRKILNKSEVVEENTLIEVISLYKLYHIVNKQLEMFRQINDNSQITKKLKMFVKNKSARVNLSYDGNESTYFYLNDGNYNSLSIYKDKNIDELYFNCLNNDNKKLYKFVKRHYNLIFEKLSMYEKYVNLIGLSSSKQFNFSDSLFTATLDVERNGKVEIRVDINENHPLREEYYKKWYKRENICDLVNKNKMEILKRISVDPYELDIFLKKIYDSYLENPEQNQKSKKLINFKTKNK